MTDMIILRERVITIKAGDTFDQNLQGNVLRVTAGLVPLRVQDRGGQMDFTLLAGERAEFPGEFPGLILSHTSGLDQTFTIQVGKGVNVASALVSGTVTITGTPTVINGGGVLTSITNPVKVIDDGLDAYAIYKSNTAMTGNTPETIFSPAANVNGAIVYLAAMVSVQLGGILSAGFIAKNSTPANVIDGDLLPLDYKIQQSATYQTSAVLQKALKIAAGKGLYYLTNAAETNALRSVAYKFL